MDVDVGVGVVDVDVDVDNLGDNERGDLSGAVDGDEGVDDNVDGDGHVGVMRSESVEDEGMDGMDEMGKEMRTLVWHNITARRFNESRCTPGMPHVLI